MDTYRQASPKHFFIATNAHVVCLDRDTGGEVWRKAVFEYGDQVSLLLSDGKLYAATTRGAACLEERDGTFVWRVEISQLTMPVSMALDFVRPGGQLFLACSGLLYALAADTGALLWKNELKGLGYNPICLRVPGAITSQPFWRTVRSSNSSRIEVLEDEQQGS